MEKLNANGKLVLAALLALTTALPLACSSDDSKGIPPGGDAGEAGEGGTGAKGGAGGKAGAGGKGGNAQGGNAQGGASAGSAGAPEAGSPEMGGEGGTTEPMGGAGGVEEMGGAGGDSGDPYQANVDAACSTKASLDCSDTGVAMDKQTCLENAAFQLDTAPPDCAPLIKALVACLAPEPATSFYCVDGVAYANDDVCADESTALGNCYAAQ